MVSRAILEKINFNIILISSWEWAGYQLKQSCSQIEISPEFGSFSGAFLGTFDKNWKVLCYFSKIWELFGSFFGCFWQICRNSVLFRELFQRFRIIWKLFGAFLTTFEIAQNFLCYFLCYFLKNSEFGRTPEFREQGTALPELFPVWKMLRISGAFREHQ